MCSVSKINPVLLLIAFILSAGAASTAQTLPAPQLQVNALSTNLVVLQWNDVEGEERYQVERMIGLDLWTQIAVLGADSNSYRDQDVIGGVNYKYRVRAAALSASSAYSGEVSITTPGLALLPPTGAPILYADPMSDTSIMLKWTDVAGETQYRVERQDRSGHWEELVALGGNSEEYVDTNLAPRTLYGYRVRAWNQGGFAPYSNEAAAITFPEPGRLPAVPRVVSFNSGDTFIDLQWNPIDGATGYRLESKAQPTGTWLEISDVTSDLNSYTHTNLTPSSEYLYRLRAYNTVGLSDYSVEESAATLAPPSPSADLQATALSFKEIRLNWKDVLTNCCTANGYIGYSLQAQHGTNWQDLLFADVDATNHVVGSLEPSTEYSFRLIALNPLPSPWSYVTVKTLDPPPIPPQLAPVLYADGDSSNSVLVKWLDVELETGYSIESQNAIGQWEEIAILPANSLSFTNSALQPSTAYAFRIRAVNLYGASPYSNEARAITRPIPVPPGSVLFRSITVSAGQLTLEFGGTIGQKLTIQSSTSLANWTDVTNVVAVTAETKVTLPLPSSKRIFYRTVTSD